MQPAQRAFLIKNTVSTACLFFVLMAAILLSLSFGPAKTFSLREIIELIFSAPLNANDTFSRMILFEIRIPRVILAALSGAALSLSGLIFQALLRNPLAEPYILGVSGGSTVGAIIAIMAGMSFYPWVALAAFSGGLLTIFIVLLARPKNSLLSGDPLILTGVMINALFSAVIMLLISLSNTEKIQGILFWLMGDLSMASLHQIKALVIFLVPSFFMVYFFSKTMNIILLGEESALSLGVNLSMVSTVLLLICALMISAIVSHTGLIGFVGLVIPHLLRLILGPDHRLLVPACILGGSSYLVCCDLLARTIVKTGEVPIGVITALIGAPVFIILFRRSKNI